MESICDVSMKSRDVDSLQTIVIMCVEKGECEPQYVVYQKHVFYTIYCGFKGLQNLHSPVRIRVAPPNLLRKWQVFSCTHCGVLILRSNRPHLLRFVHV